MTTDRGSPPPTDESAFMDAALALAPRALGWASPNPAVGCVLVRDGTVVGEGWTQPYGGAHAEVEALAQAGSAARGATAYVTLMPCAHHGKTPPCTEALIQAGVTRVVAALDDPDPTSRDGRTVLSRAGIAVETGLRAREAFELIAGFVKYLRTAMPLVRLKYAMSADGKIATHSGDSNWVSGPEARAEVQRLRQQSDAIVIGVGTLLADDPRLTVRPNGDPPAAPPPWQPKRVVIDSLCRTPPTSRLLREAGGPVYIVTTAHAPRPRRSALTQAGARVLVVPEVNQHVDVEEALYKLAEEGILTVLCEGGGLLGGALVDSGLVDEVVVYVAPKIVGGSEAPSPVSGHGVSLMEHAHPLADPIWDRLGNDMRLRGRLGTWSWAENLFIAAPEQESEPSHA